VTWPDHYEGLSIVIPTYNERENVAELLAELRRIGPRLTRPYEVVLVDDRSPDGTGDIAERLARELGLEVRVLSRDGERSMGGATAAGVRACSWDLVCVMDADLSHPPSFIPTMLESLDGADGVVASRYVPGARIESWPVARHLMSYIATALARSTLHVRCRDPLSGFFLFPRSLLEQISITGDGNKPLLEVLVRAEPIVNEVAYHFRNRKNGRSKLTAGNIAEFLGLLVVLRSGLRKRLKAPQVPTRSGTSETRKP